MRANDECAPEESSANWITEPAFSVRLFCSVNAPLVLPSPPWRTAPAVTITGPVTVPLPPNVPPLFTVTVPLPVPEPAVLLASSVPALTCVGPV